MLPPHRVNRNKYMAKENNILRIIKNNVGSVVSCFVLLGMLVGYVIFLQDMRKDIDVIKNNELYHMGIDIGDMKRDIYNTKIDIGNIYKSVSKIEGYLEK